MRNTANTTSTRRAASPRPRTTPAPTKRPAASDYRIDPAAVAEAIVGRRSALVALGVAKPAAA